MKVLLINGSPHKEGCTYTALKEISNTLKEESIESEIYNIDTKTEACRACYACAKLGKCIIDDKVNDFIEYAREFDGYVIGSPVHYASASGSAVSFLDRAFFAGSRNPKGSPFIHKPGASVVSARRAGTTFTFDQLNKYFTITQMPVISGRYWNMVHGATPEDVKKDLEGLQNMRILARNMAWHLKCKEAGEKTGVSMPKTEEITFTNFIR